MAYKVIHVGTGGFGGAWCQAFLPPNIQDGLIEVVAAVDINPEALKNAKDHLGLRDDQCYTDVRKAFDENKADFCSIVVPPAYHESIVDIALALWPAVPTIGEKGTPVGGRRAGIQLQTLGELAEGRSMTVTLTERDINGFVEYGAGTVEADALSIAVREGYFGVRMTRVAKARQIGSFRIAPRFTYDVLFVPVGGRVVARKATLGHLPLWGPFRNMAVKAIHGVVSSHREWTYLQHATKFEVGGGKIAIQARK